mgnify:CR=1 FL=1
MPKAKGPVYLIEDRGHDTPCWVWQRYKDKHGYGLLSPNSPYERRAHREYFKRARGYLPYGLDLDHLCRVTSCVNPAHLEPVTRQINIHRGKMAALIAPNNKKPSRPAQIICA